MIVASCPPTLPPRILSGKVVDGGAAGTQDQLSAPLAVRSSFSDSLAGVHCSVGTRHQPSRSTKPGNVIPLAPVRPAGILPAVGGPWTRRFYFINSSTFVFQVKNKKILAPSDLETTVRRVILSAVCRHHQRRPRRTWLDGPARGFPDRSQHHEGGCHENR